jgi:hypothetical protein
MKSLAHGNAALQLVDVTARLHFRHVTVTLMASDGEG